MAYLYDEIANRVEPRTYGRSRTRCARCSTWRRIDFPQAKRLSEKDNWDLSLIDEIQKSGFLDQLYR